MKTKKNGNNWTAYYDPDTNRYFAEIIYTSREGREQYDYEITKEIYDRLGSFGEDYENEELIAITKELADTLRKNRTIDWQKRDSARAKMRMLIKRLLKHHKYPPEGMDDAVQTVMTQCELWADNNEMGERVNAYSDRLNQYVNETYDMGMVAEPKTDYKKNGTNKL